MMTDELELERPILVAVWPGMGHVAINGGIYMLAKLSMHLYAEFSANDLFDIESVEVKGGLVGATAFPRSRLFAWKDPKGKNDLLIFIGEAQPPVGKYQFCQKLIDFVKNIGVERVFTFAAMATEMRPEHHSRVFGVATDVETLAELKRLELDILEDGQIGGLNGVLLSAAAQAGLHGACLLGEIPHVFSQYPFPKASLVVLEAFSTIAGVDIDVSELTEQSKAVEEKLSELLTAAERAIAGESTDELETFSAHADEGRLESEDRDRIEKLFQESKRNRSRAYELKRELDRLNVFKDYEDRFLDLFQSTE